MNTISWHEANLAYIMAATRLVQARLEAMSSEAEGSGESLEDLEEKLGQAHAAMPSAPAIDTLAETFGLTSFERSVILLCMAMELDPTCAQLCAAANGHASRAYPTFHLAMVIGPEPHWDATAPQSSLGLWQLIEMGTGPTLTTAPLRISERIFHYLLGIPCVDRRFIGLVEPLESSTELIGSHKETALRLARLLAQSSEESERPVMLLCGGETEGKRSVMAWACDWLELNPYLLKGTHLPPLAEEQMMMARLWEREGLLSSALLMLDCNDVETRQMPAVMAFVERLRAPVVVMTPEPLHFSGRPVVRFDIGKPSIEEQKTLWESTLGPLAEGLNGQVDQVISHFNMGIHGIRSAGAEITGLVQGGRTDLPTGALWNACRMQARPRLDDLANRITPHAAWDDLILPDMQKNTLRQLVAHVRQRMKVYQQWGFAGRSSRGLGTSALFAGPSGTGKTLSAEVIAAELQLDLYHIDLSQVVSKYIGETEKNLRRIFDAAEEAGAVLLFDEADALFGKRSEVKDSHDRHANIEVSYLLQRMEAYRGLAILTSNMKQALDTAFLRRIRFIVNFPFPDPTSRAEIWWRVFPESTPMDGVDVNKLANLNVSGGSIWNIALNAAFLAADAGEPIRMNHLLQASRSEYVKLEKQLTDAEIRGWV